MKKKTKDTRVAIPVLFYKIYFEPYSKGVIEGIVKAGWTKWKLHKGYPNVKERDEELEWRNKEFKGFMKYKAGTYYPANKDIKIDSYK